MSEQIKTFRKWYEDKFQTRMPLYIPTEEKHRLMDQWKQDNPISSEGERKSQILKAK